MRRMNIPSQQRQKFLVLRQIFHVGRDHLVWTRPEKNPMVHFSFEIIKLLSQWCLKLIEITKIPLYIFPRRSDPLFFSFFFSNGTDPHNNAFRLYGTGNWYMLWNYFRYLMIPEIMSKLFKRNHKNLGLLPGDVSPWYESEYVKPWLRFPNWEKKEKHPGRFLYSIKDISVTKK